MSDALRRPLPPSVFARLADATRYVITGVSPDTWFGPLQPLAPMAPPEVKGRQWDYPFGANLNYIPRADKTDAVNAQFEAEDFNRKLGATLHAVSAAELPPRR